MDVMSLSIDVKSDSALLVSSFVEIAIIFNSKNQLFD